MAAAANIVEQVAEPAAATPAAGNDAAEKAALIAELDAEEGAEGEEAPPPKPTKVSKPKSAESDEKSDDETADDEQSDAADDDEEEDEESPGEFESIDDFRDHAKELLTSGKLRDLETLLGLEKGALKINGAKLRHIRDTAEAAARAKQEGHAAKEHGEMVLTEAKRQYGSYAQARVDFASGSSQGVLRAARAIEGHFGVPMATLVDMVVKAGRGEASQAVQQQGGSSELAELKANQERLFNLIQSQQQNAGAEARKATDVTKIAARLKGTDLAKLKDGAARVYDRLVGSYDPATKGYKLNLQTAIKAVQEDKATKYDLLMLKQRRSPPSETLAPVPIGKNRVRAVATEAKPQTRADKEAAEKAALIAELDREERAAERSARRSGGSKR